MKTSCFRVENILLALLFALVAEKTVLAQVTVSPANFVVTTPNFVFQYFLNGEDPGKPAASVTDDSVDFTLNAGASYIFNINTANFHPVDICTNADTSSFYVGASTSNVFSDNIVVTIPASNYPPFLYYICNFHLFYGTITINPPLPPPDVTITGACVSTNIFITFSGGTNTISLVPQYTSNTFSGNWANVPAYTNTFSGTGVSNTISFGRLDAVCGPNVYLRISQAPN